MPPRRQPGGRSASSTGPTPVSKVKVAVLTTIPDEVDEEKMTEKRRKAAEELQVLSELVNSSVTSEGWTESGEEQVRSALSNFLPVNDLLPLHFLLRSLLRSSLPIASLSPFFSGFSNSDGPSNAHFPALMEALLDVVEDLKQEREDIKYEEDSVKADLDKQKKGETEGVGAEIINTEPVDDSAPNDLDRPLDLIKALIESGALASSMVSHILDPSSLANPPLKLLPALSRYNARALRHRTAQFYKQKKYNLLRESSEGWARLLVVLSDISAFGPGGDDEDPESRRRNAKLTWKRIMAVIGCFDLSPTRVLDIILDAFAENVLLHWKFFLDLLRCSSWGHSDGNKKGKGKALNVDTDMETDAEAGLTEFVKSIAQETGNQILAQVLGFKFAHYQLIDKDLKGVERTVQQTPMELVFITAILMREGLLRTVDILPHLSPSDAEMDQLINTYTEKTRNEIRGLGGNALTQSVLRDDDDDTPAADTTPAQQLTDDSSRRIREQRVLLSEALLSIGHLPPAFYIISRWPVVVHYSPTIAELILRIVKHCMEPAYASISHKNTNPTSSPIYRSHFSWRQTKEQHLVLTAPAPIDSEKRTFKFFFSEWSDRLVQWVKMDEVIKQASPLMAFVGAMGARDVSVLVQLCRIGVQHLKQDSSSEIRKAWTNLIRTTLLPSMPLLPANFAYNNEIWPLLEPLSYNARYALYGEWHVAMTKPGDRRYVPAMALAAARTMNDAKQVLKRMTSDIDRAHARAFGKGSYSAPTALWSVILPQIMSYQNMRDTVVKAARYLSRIGWDVTVFMLLDALSDPTKSRVKDDGLSASSWLQSVATFIGEIASKHSSMDLVPVIQQIANQLKNRSLADLITLKHLISKMSGIDPLHDISNHQIACFSGGPLLSAEGANATRSLNDEPPRTDIEKASALRTKKQPKKRANYDSSTKRLVGALQSTSLALPILIAIAQARKSCVFTAGESSRHTKQLGLSFDECHGIFDQYCRFLSTAMTPSEYADFVPTLQQFIVDFELEPAVSFEVLRPKFSYQLYTREVYLRLGFKMKKYLETLGEQVWWEDGSWEPPLIPVMLDIAATAEDSVKQFKLEPFAATFWSLTLPELGLPETTYGEVSDRLKTLVNKLGEWSRRDVALNDDWAKAYSRDREFASSRIKDLAFELEEQKRIVTDARARLEKEAKMWLPDYIVNGVSESLSARRRRAAVLHFNCFLPRAIFSPIDAVFVAKFARILHELNTDNFSLLMFYENFFSDGLASVIFSSTEQEAHNFGRCLNHLLGQIDPWRSNEGVYKAQALGVGQGPDGTDAYQGMRIKPEEQLSWEGFRKVCNKWQIKLLKAVTTCLASDDYMHIKNGVSFARAVIPYFPRNRAQFNELMSKLSKFPKDELAREDPREDLMMAVKTYENALTLASRDINFKLILVEPPQRKPTPVAKTELLKPVVKVAPSPVQSENKAEVQATSSAIAPAIATSIANANAMEVDEPSLKPEMPVETKSMSTTPMEDSAASPAASDAAIKRSQEMQALRERIAKSKGLKANADKSSSPALETDKIQAADVKSAIPTGPKANGLPLPVGEPRANVPEPRTFPTEPRSRLSSASAPLSIPAAPRGPRNDIEKSMPGLPQKPVAHVQVARSGMRSDAMKPPVAAPLRNDREDDRKRPADGPSQSSRPSSRAGSPPARGGRSNSIESRRSTNSKGGDRERRHERERDRDRDRDHRDRDRDDRGRRHDDDRANRIDPRDRDRGGSTAADRERDRPVRQERDDRRDRERGGDRDKERERDRDPRERERDREKDRARHRERDRREPDAKEKERRDADAKDKDRRRDRERDDRHPRDRDDRRDQREPSIPDKARADERERDRGRRDREPNAEKRGTTPKSTAGAAPVVAANQGGPTPKSTSASTPVPDSDPAAPDHLTALTARFEAREKNQEQDYNTRPDNRLGSRLAERMGLSESAKQALKDESAQASVREPSRTRPGPPRELVDDRSRSEDTRNNRQGATNGTRNSVDAEGPSRTSENPPAAPSAGSLRSRITGNSPPVSRPGSPSRRGMNSPGSRLHDSLNRAMSPAGTAGTTERKRPIEENQEGARGTSPASSGKRQRVDRNGGRDHRNAAGPANVFSRLSGSLRRPNDSR